MEILKATNLSKIYQTGENAVYALNDVSLTLQEGSFVAITGPSGSGKSTLLHLLSGLDKPTHGSVLYRDKELYKYNDNQLSVLRRRRFGFVFQSYNLVKELTGYENMLLPVMLDGKKPDEAYLNRIIEILGIGDRLSHLPDVIDPSHATGHSWMVDSMAVAATAIGADGLIIEVHNDPPRAKCDGAQSQTPAMFTETMKKVSSVRGLVANW